MLFTVLLDYRGGTYVSQVQAETPAEAVQAWAASLDPKVVHGLGPSGKKDLVRVLAEDVEGGSGPVLLDGLTNVWCTSALMRGAGMTINIVSTCTRLPPRQKQN